MAGRLPRIKRVSVTIPAQELAKLKAQVAAYHAALDQVIAKGFDVSSYREIVAGLKQALAQKKYYEIRSILMSYQAQKLMALREGRPWYLLGPFPNPENEEAPEHSPGKGFDTVYPPEKELNFTKTYQGAEGKPIKWVLVADASSGIDFNPLFQPNEWVVVYGATNVYSPQARDVNFQVGSDDGIKVWLNGELIHTFARARAFRSGEDVFPAKLKAGWNSILIKVEEEIGGWLFDLVITNPEGQPLSDLKWSQKVP